MSLLLAGLANGFKTEIEQTVNGVGADHWTMTVGSNGVLTAFSPFPQGDLAEIAREPGVSRVAPFLLLPGQSTKYQGAAVRYILAGVVPGHLGDPAVAPGDGHGLAAANQVVVDSGSAVKVGTVVDLGIRPFSVVGSMPNRTLTGGIPIFYVELPAAQSIAVGGRALITSAVSLGAPSQVPSGLLVYSSQGVINYTIDSMQEAIASISNSTYLMLVVVALIVAALLYVAALERRRDFAILKAVGASSTELFGSLVLEAVVVTLVGAGLAEVLANSMKFIFKQPVSIPLSAYLQLPLIAIVVGLVASLVALRKATGADPAAAFS